jgi:hypothetical protein
MLPVITRQCNTGSNYAQVVYRSFGRLQGGASLRDKSLEVGLEPGASLGCVRGSIRESAGRVEANRGAVRGTVALTTGLDPDDGVDERVTSVGRRASTEAGTLDVAPVTPLLTDVLDTRASLVDDEVGGEVVLRKQGSEGVDVVGLFTCKPWSAPRNI